MRSPRIAAWVIAWGAAFYLFSGWTEAAERSWLDGTSVIQNQRARRGIRADGVPHLPFAARQMMPARAEAEPQLGSRRTFWIVDFTNFTLYGTLNLNEDKVQLEGELVRISPHAYLYLETGFYVEPDLLDDLVGEFEGSIYPNIGSVFGAPPDALDADPRVTIFVSTFPGTSLSGATVAGYFDDANQYTDSEGTFMELGHSNETEMIYVNREFLVRDPFTGLLDPTVLGIFAHEYQHLVHWALDRDESIWLNEGCSEYAMYLCGFEDIAAQHMEMFSVAPTVSLTQWVNQLESYGAVYYFMRYLADHYGGNAAIAAIAGSPLEGAESVDAYLRANGGKTFQSVFRDWTMANLLDTATGDYSYSLEMTPLWWRNLYESVGIHLIFPVFFTQRSESYSTLNFETYLPVHTGEYYLFHRGFGEDNAPYFASVSVDAIWDTQVTYVGLNRFGSIEPYVYTLRGEAPVQLDSSGNGQFQIPTDDDAFALVIRNMSATTDTVSGAENMIYRVGTSSGYASNVVQDLTAPATVTDLAVESVEGNRATLTWTVPGDDGTLGRASLYDLRYNTDPIFLVQYFDFSPRIANVVQPGLPGTIERKLCADLPESRILYFMLRVEDDAGNRSHSNVLSLATGVKDVTAPGQIADLHAVQQALGELAVGWTAPGDDGAVGQAEGYDLRVSRTAITDELSFRRAEPVDTPAPAPSGTPEQRILTGLGPDNHMVYVALRTRDEVDNVSPISNVLSYYYQHQQVSATPQTPDLLPASDTGVSNSDNLTNRNNSSSERTLQFWVGGTVAGATVVVFSDGVPIGSGVAAGPVATVTTDGSTNLAGGGHSITARQTESGKLQSGVSGALSVTVDTSAPLVEISSSAPNPTEAIPIPVTAAFSEAVFGFALGDVAVSNATIVGFTGSDSSYGFDLLPVAGGLVTADVATGVAFDAAGNGNLAAVQFSRTFNNLPPAAAGDTYKTAMNTALSVPAPGVLANDNDPNGGPLTAGLVTDVSHGTLLLNPDGSLNYTPNPDFIGMDGFTYRATDGQFFSDAASVVITVGAVIASSPTLISAEADAGTHPATQTLTIWNEGGGTLSYILETTPSWLEATPAFGFSDDFPSRSEHQIGFQTSRLWPGDYAGTITVVEPAAMNHPVDIPVDLTVAPSPVTLAVTWPSTGDSWQSGMPGQLAFSCANLPAPGGLHVYVLRGGAYLGYLGRVPCENGDNVVPTRLTAGLTPGSDYRLQVFWTENNSVSARSEPFTVTVSPTITINRPTTGDSWQSGMAGQMAFSCANLPAPGELHVYVLRGGAYLGYLGRVPCENGDNVVSIRLTAGLAPGSDYRLRVFWTESKAVYAWSDPFAVTAPPAIAINRPTTGDSWQSGMAGQMAFSCANLPAPGELHVYVLRGGAYLGYLGRVPCENGDNVVSVLLPAGLAPGSDYRLRVFWTESKAVYAWSDPFTVTAAPAIAVNRPTTGDSWQSGASGDLTFSCTGFPAPGELHLYLLRGGAYLRYFGRVPFENGNNVVSVSLPAGLAPGSDYRFRLLWTEYLAVDAWSGDFIVF